MNQTESLNHFWKKTYKERNIESLVKTIQRFRLGTGREL